MPGSNFLYKVQALYGKLNMLLVIPMVLNCILLQKHKTPLHLVSNASSMSEDPNMDENRFQVQMAKILLENGASVHVKENLTKRTPLHIAMKSGYEEVAQLLIAKGADMNAEDALGDTPNLIAVRKLLKAYLESIEKDDVESVKNLASKGALNLSILTLTATSKINTPCRWKNSSVIRHLAVRNIASPVR